MPQYLNDFYYEENCNLRAGGLGREVKMLINHVNETKSKSSQWEFIGYDDDDGMERGKMVNGFPVLGGAEDLNNIQEETELLVAVADPKVRKSIIKKISNDHISYPIAIHPTVLIGTGAVEIGEGTIICASCIISVNISIGKHVILNVGCTIGHDTITGDYCSFMPAIIVFGEVTIGESVYGGTAIGMPARPVKFHTIE